MLSSKTWRNIPSSMSPRKLNERHTNSTTKGDVFSDFLRIVQIFLNTIYRNNSHRMSPGIQISNSIWTKKFSGRMLPCPVCILGPEDPRPYPKGLAHTYDRLLNFALTCASVDHRFMILKAQTTATQAIISHRILLRFAWKNTKERAISCKKIPRIAPRDIVSSTLAPNRVQSKTLIDLCLILLRIYRRRNPNIPTNRYP